MERVPEHYFDIICCPRCKSELEEHPGTPQQLRCAGCGNAYPVMDGIPVLMTDVDDRVSRVIKAFYDEAWKPDDRGVTKAKVWHEDLSDLGQRYIQVNERRFEATFDDGGQYFLDAAAGAQPRERFGAKFSFHICLDFSRDGLVECRRSLGDRAICICGSLLELPIKDSVCDGIIASHCIYHIDKDEQQRALSELARVQRSGKTLVFYSNPDAWERKLINGIKSLIGRRRPDEPSQSGSSYFYAHPVPRMLEMFASEFEDAEITVKPLRMFSTNVSTPLFKLKVIGPLAMCAFCGMEKWLGGNTRPAQLVSYIVDKGAHSNK